jgi:pyruvate,water dikinase
VEWAWSEGIFWLLQARPITAGVAAEREQVRREEMAALSARADPGGTVWSRYNLSEVLPEPTPMTWAIVRRLMSGQGGLGLMYRDLGFEPDRALDEEGIYDLICGRPYCNLSREPGMYANGLPFGHSIAALKAAPHKAMYPKAQPNWSRAGWRFWLFLPAVFIRTIRLSLRLNEALNTCARRLREEILPRFAQETRAAAEKDPAGMDEAGLLAALQFWIRRTLWDFARDSLKPTVLAALEMSNLEQTLVKRLGSDRGRTALSTLVTGVRPDAEADLAAGLSELAAGRLQKESFLQRFGHRGSHEMELSEPRWAEQPTALDHLATRPMRQPREKPDIQALLEQITQEAKLKPAQIKTLTERLERLATYLRLRETSKHYLMKGYALIRRFLLELDHRHQLGGGVFYLLPEEMPRLIAGEDLSALIAQRRRRRTLALSLEVPQVLFSDDLEAIGRPMKFPEPDTLQGVPLSAGYAEGPALVLQQPSVVRQASEPYVLVCPSTDPAWIPLFIHARALVMETGGVLSHGAIVAREFGLPAIAGLPGIHQRLRSGQRLRVDGTTGRLMILPSEQEAAGSPIRTRSGVLLDRLFDRAPGPCQVVRDHDRVDLDAGIEG